MAVALETVVKQLDDSGIIAPGKLEDFIPPKAHPKTVEELVAGTGQSRTSDEVPGPASQGRQSQVADPGQLHDPRQDRRRRHGPGLQGRASPHEAHRGDQDAAAGHDEGRGGRRSLSSAKSRRRPSCSIRTSSPPTMPTRPTASTSWSWNTSKGNDLSALVKKNGPFPVAKAVNYILQAARGLEFAHSEGRRPSRHQARQSAAGQRRARSRFSTWAWPASKPAAMSPLRPN